MAVTVPDAPEELTRLAANWIGSLPPLANPSPEGILIYRPLPLYGGTRESLAADGAERPSFQQVGWRVLVDEGPSFAVVELRPGGGGFEVVGAWRGQAAATLAEATAVAEDQAPAGFDWEVRVLSVPEARIEAIWLRGGNDDDLAIRLGEEALRMAALSLSQLLQAKPARRDSGMGPQEVRMQDVRTQDRDVP